MFGVSEITAQPFNRFRVYSPQYDPQNRAGQTSDAALILPVSMSVAWCAELLAVIGIQQELVLIWRP